MRLMLKLQAQKDVAQKEFQEKYPSSMNSFLYGCLEQKENFSKLHDENKFKGFCFGNLHPVKNKKIKQDEVYSVTISSSNPQIIETLFFTIKVDESVNLGEGSFKIVESGIQRIELEENSTLETLSVINVTENNEGNIKALSYLREKEKYLEGLRKNLIRKYNSLKNKSVDESFDLFEGIEIKPIKGKEHAIPILFDNKKFNCIGNKLSFKIKELNETQREVFQTCLDAGFGERNSYGMGFMLARRDKK